MKNRSEWRESFIEWLESDPADDVMSDLEDGSDNEGGNYNSDSGEDED